MPRPIALLTADAHLQNRAWSDRRELAGDAYWAFDQMVNYAINKKVAYFIEAGDGIDVKLNEPQIVEFAQSRLKKLHEHDVEFCFVDGDHDFMRPSWFTSIFPESVHLDGKLMHIDDFGTIVGMDYSKEGLRGETLERLQSLVRGQDITMAVMHQKWKELLGFEGAYDSTFDDVPLEIPLLLTGDKHGHAKIEHHRKHGDLTVLSPGATCKQSINEPDTHFFYVWMSDGTVESVQLRSRPILRVQTLIDSEARFNGMLETLPNLLAKTAKANSDLPVHIRKPILYVPYATGVGDFYDRLLDAVNDKAFVFTKELSVEHVSGEVSVKQNKWSQTIEEGLEGALRVVVPDEDLRVKASRLLRSGDVYQELVNMKKEFGL